MDNDAEKNAIVKELKILLEPYIPKLYLKSDGDSGFYLETNKIDNKGAREFFASAQAKKNYVSFYLMPIYCYPELTENISAALKKRMQGKSCFNFKKPEPDLFEELGRVVKLSFEKYKSEGKI